MLSKTTRYERLLEAVPDALVGMDQKGVIRFVNRQTESLFGYDRDDLVGQPIEALVPESLWQIYAEHREGYFSDPRTRSMGLDLKLTGRRRDGTELPVNISMSSIDTGDVLLVITAVREVADQELAVKNAGLIAAVVEASADAIISLTLDGIVTSWNPAAERMYGYSSEEVVGRPFEFLLPKGRASEVDTVIAWVKDGQVIEDALYSELPRKDGTPVPISITISPIRDADGKVIGVVSICRDVTVQRRAFEAAQRMAAIVQDSDEAILSGSLDGRITSFNRAAEELFGYRAEEVIGQPAAILLPKGQEGEVKDVLAKIKAGQHVEHLETSRVRKDGTVLPVSVSVSPVRGTDGAVVGTSVIYRDMTAQRQALEATQRIAAIVEYSDDAIISSAPDGTITSWNPAAERLYGYSSEAVIGQPAGFLTPKDLVGEIKAILAKINAGQHVEHLETRRVRKDGTVFPVSLSVSPIGNENGAIAGISAIHRDLTKVQQEAMYTRSLIEASLDPLVTITPEGTINDVNEAAVTATGIPRDELIGTDFSHLFTDPDKAHEGYQQTFAEGAVTDLPLTLRHRDGSLKDILFNASVYRDIVGKVLGVVATARSIGKRQESFDAG